MAKASIKMRKKEEKSNFFHIYNRGVDKRIIFKNHINYLHFLELLKSVNSLELIGSLYHYKQNGDKSIKKNSKKLVEIISYSLIPNHFHLLVREVSENGVSKFMHKIGTGYTNHFNYKNERTGYLFQGPYKSVLVDNDDYLNYLSAYIFGNSEIHGVCRAEKYKYSNYNLALSGRSRYFRKYILKDFSDIGEYKEYVKEAVKNSKNMKADKKHYIIE